MDRSLYNGGIRQNYQCAWTIVRKHFEKRSIQKLIYHCSLSKEHFHLCVKCSYISSFLHVSPTITFHYTVHVTRWWWSALPGMYAYVGLIGQVQYVSR